MNCNKQRLFSVAKDIDDKVAMVKKKAIVLVGLSRVGKSTSYNWILRHPLLAEKESNKICYNPQSIRTDTAEVKSGFKSCTMVPNIVTLDKDTSLIDMPGFGDARDYVGTLAVSYSLKAIFEAVDEVKFVVVISESYLRDQDGLKLCKALSHFLQLFDFDALPSLKEDLFKATTLLVTQSKYAAEHLDFIESAMGNLEDPQLENIKNREEIHSLLQHLRENNRVDQFSAAKMACPPEECKIFDYYDTKDWESLHLKQPREADAIRVPFKEQYKAMEDHHKKSFDKAIEQRKNSYKSFSSIFVQMFQDILQEGTIHNIHLPYESFFKQVTTFIKDNDHYNSEKAITQQQLISARFSRPQKETLLKLIMQFGSVVDEFEVEYLRQEPLKVSLVLTGAINRLIDLIITIFCREQSELKLVLQLKLILLRGVREFYMLGQVDKANVTTSFNSISDGFQSMLDRDFQHNLLRFVNCFDLTVSERVTFGEKKSANVVENYFSSRENAYALEILFILHEDKWMRFENQDKDQYYQIMRDTKLIHAKYEHEKGCFRESCEYLLEAYRLQLKYEENCLKRLKYDLDRTQYFRKVEEMHLNQENILDMLRQNLLKLDRVQEALDLAKNMGWVHSTCQAYDLRLKEELSKRERCELVQQYAEYCLEHGRRERGVELLQQLQQQDRGTFARRKQISQIIYNSIQNWQMFEEKYKEFLDKLETIDLFNPDRKDIITRIQNAIRDSSELNSVILLCRNKVCQSANMLTQQQSRLILKKYLEERLSKEAVVAQNGFSVQYIEGEASNYKVDQKRERLCSSVKIGNIVQLQQLSPRLLVLLEKESKSINSDKERVITIDLEKVTRHDQEVSAKHMVVKLSNQQMQPTFEYASRTVKKLRKIVYEPFERIKQLIESSTGILQELAGRVQKYLLQRYYESSQDVKNRVQVRKLMHLIHENPESNNDTIGGKFAAVYPQSKLMKTEILEMVEYIRERAREELTRDMLEDMQGVNESLSYSSYQ